LTIGTIINVMGLTVFAVEAGLLITKRAKCDQHIVSDARSRRMIWKTIGIGIGVTFLSKVLLPHPVFAGHSFEYGSAAILISGMALRWFSIFFLGKEFNVNVAIIEGHRLVTSGPYQLIRHPSFAGLLLISLGLGIHSNHIVGMLALSLPVFWAIRNRISIEEKAMEAFFGVEYTEYRKRTRKLIPFVY
jgi:protein-S-isoprenylcysteine O-methyltransferase Ste14